MDLFILVLDIRTKLMNFCLKASSIYCKEEEQE